jgi:hypothetical protein
LVTEFLPTPNARDFDLLRNSRRYKAWRVSLAVVLILIGLFFLGLVGTFVLRSQIGHVTSLQAQGTRLAQLRQPWSSEFVQEWARCQEWLVHHGTSSEADLFNGLSGLVIESMLNSNSASVREAELTTFGRTFLAIHMGIVRVIFFMIASLRLWFAVSLIALARGLRDCKPYRALDALGQMGNGRVFYSGARAGVESVTDGGIPDRLIRGFACPQTSSVQEAKSSELWRLLTEYAVASPTNLALTQILLRHRDTAAYVASSGEEDALEDVFVETGLFNNTVALVREALALHGEYAAQSHCDDPPSDSCSIENDRSVPYAERVRTALHRALTPRMRHVLGAVPAGQVATLVLAFGCGKVLAHSFEGERWVRRSIFPHLSARAVLHSLVEYPQDYDVTSRSRLRRALVYASRRSPFAPIRLPVDFEDDVLALRQWAEVLLACPHELPQVAVDLELFAVLRETNTVWQERFFDSATEDLSSWRASAYTTRTDLLFIPLITVVKALRGVVDPEYLVRLQTLLASAAATQRQTETRASENEGAPPNAFASERAHALPSHDRIEALGSAHGVAAADMRDWLVLRHVLLSFGWLASRVGDYSVPETGAVFAVFQATPVLSGANSQGRLGLRGMIPLRGSKVRERLGTGWSALCTHVDRVTIADREQDFEKLLQGIEERAPAEEGDEDLVAVSRTS